MGVRYAKPVLGTGRDGQFAEINIKFWKNWTTLLGSGHFSRDLISISIILKGIGGPPKGPPTTLSTRMATSQSSCLFSEKSSQSSSLNLPTTDRKFHVFNLSEQWFTVKHVPITQYCLWSHWDQILEFFFWILQPLSLVQVFGVVELVSQLLLPLRKKQGSLNSNIIRLLLS